MRQLFDALKRADLRIQAVSTGPAIVLFLNGPMDHTSLVSAVSRASASIGRGTVDGRRHVRIAASHRLLGEVTSELIAALEPRFPKEAFQLSAGLSSFRHLR